MSDALLYRAQLNGADLRGAIFHNTKFGGVSFKGANLDGARFMGNDIKWDGKYPPLFPTLPDGAKWTPETDMAKFINPKHPEYQATLEKINAIRKDMGIEPIK